ncbi:MAG TPA: SurA N-terminal domain-containing protein [Solirubrobacterales bacterium]|nr:SurA N-terminal domain-containing protein [Solirubrobacterales bacterium]
MVPNLPQRRRSTGWQWLALLAFAILFAFLFGAFAIVQGIGRPSVPSGAVAIVEDVPGELGTVTDAEFRHALARSAAQSQIEPVPKPGDAEYDTLREAALRSLFDPIWIRGQAAEMGISAAPKEIAGELEKLKQNYKTEKEYDEFLSQADDTKADIEEVVTTQLLSTRVLEQISEETPQPSESEVEDYYEAAKSSKYTTHGRVKSLDEVTAQVRKQLAEQAAERASSAYLRGYIGRWTARTFCAPGFAVVTHCSNFEDSRPPESDPACYEAKPKGGRPEVCEAPVPQVKPAQPGTVSPLNPEGQKLAQAPRPPGLEAAASEGGEAPSGE